MAEHEQHPWELFTVCLHNIFLAVPRTRKVRDDEIGVLFDAKHGRTPKNSYPWHQL